MVQVELTYLKHSAGASYSGHHPVGVEAVQRAPESFSSGCTLVEHLHSLSEIAAFRISEPHDEDIVIIVGKHGFTRRELHKVRGAALHEIAVPVGRKNPVLIRLAPITVLVRIGQRDIGYVVNSADERLGSGSQLP